MLTLHNGQRLPLTGWFIDTHGHQLYLREGDLAPACPHLGPVLPALWRLIREIGVSPRTPAA